MAELTRRVVFLGGPRDGAEVVVRCDLSGNPPLHLWVDAAGHVAPNQFPTGDLYTMQPEVSRQGAQIYRLV